MPKLAAPHSVEIPAGLFCLALPPCKRGPRDLYQAVVQVQVCVCECVCVCVCVFVRTRGTLLLTGSSKCNSLEAR